MSGEAGSVGRCVPNSNLFIDETILSTPTPQASSTIDRKSSANNALRHYIRNAERNVVIPNESLTHGKSVRDTEVCSINLSTQSSLGILSLNNMEDIRDVLLDDEDKKRSSTVNDITSASSFSNSLVAEKLMKQRLLAKKALERAESKTKATVDELPSYLLKTPGRNLTTQSAFTRAGNDSTINLSDLENSLPKNGEDNNLNQEKLSFQVKEISARSSSIGTTNSTGLQKNDVSRSDDSMETRLSKLFEKLSEAGLHVEMSSAQEQSGSNDSCISFTPQDSLIAKFQDELFIPGELAVEQIFKELASSVDASLPINAIINSKFSICDAGDLSLRSKLDSTSIEEFFQRKTPAVDELNLKSSPVKTRDPIPLIDITADEEDEEVVETEIQRPSLTKKSVSEDLSALSNSISLDATRIAEILAKMDAKEPPSRIMDYLLKAKLGSSHVEGTEHADISGPSVSSTTIINDNSTLKNQQQSSTLADSTRTIVGDTSDTSTKENSPRKKRKSLSNRPKSILKDTSNSLVKCIEQNQYNTKTEQGEAAAEWVDVKQQADKVNHTLSSIVSDSPASYTCSELDFSEDDRPDSISSPIRLQPKKWIEIPSDHLTVYKAQIGIASELVVPVTSLLNHWVVVRVCLASLAPSNAHLDIELPSAEVLLKDINAHHRFRIRFTVLHSGQLDLVLDIEATDMTAKTTQTIQHSVTIHVDTPDLQLSMEHLNFGLVPESIVKRLPLVLNNSSMSDLHLSFQIEQDVEVVYMFGTEEDDKEKRRNEWSIQIDKSQLEPVVQQKCVVQKGRSYALYVEMHTPSLAQLSCSENVTDLQGKIIMSMTDPKSGTEVHLRDVPLMGSVGLTKIQFRASCIPLVLVPGETKPLQMKNSGLVQMELSIAVFDGNQNTPDPHFTIDPPRICLTPNQSASVNVTYTNTNDSLTTILKRTVRLYPVDYGHMNFLCIVEVHPPPKTSKSVVLMVPSRTTTTATTTTRSPSPRYHRSSAGSPVTSNRHSPLPPASSRASSHHSDVSSTSTTTTSTKYLQDGKLPIETTRADLVWGCVRVGNTATQHFILRNKCNQRIRLQACVNGKDFKIVKDQSEKVNSVLLALQAMESRTITVTLAPSSVGACHDRLLFLPMDGVECGQPIRRQRVALFGYGGHASISIQNVAKDPSGKMWLCFGGLDYDGAVLQQNFILRNIGNVSAFALMSVRCKALYPFMDSSVTIEPSEVVLAARQEIIVRVQFRPRRDDFKYLDATGHNNADVSEIASVQIISGPEPTRGRVRRLFRKMQQQASASAFFSSDLLMTRLSVTLPNEVMPVDLSLCKESAAGLKDLLRDLDIRELVLTVERTDTDRHGFVSVLAPDDTCVFHSVCDETTNMTFDEPAHLHPTTTMATTVTTTVTTGGQRRVSGGFCTVEPRHVLLTPPVKCQDTVIISSRHSRPMPFEVTCTSDYIEVSPRVGIVPPSETTFLHISYTTEPPDSVRLHKIMVYVENEVMDIDVKIVNVKSRRTHM